MWFCFVWFWPRLLHFSLVFHYHFSSLLSSSLLLFSFLFSFHLVVWTVLFMAQPNTYSGRFSPNLVNFKQATKRTEATPISSNLSGKLLLASISFFFLLPWKTFSHSRKKIFVSNTSENMKFMLENCVFGRCFSCYAFLFWRLAILYGNHNANTVLSLYNLNKNYL